MDEMGWYGMVNLGRYGVRYYCENSQGFFYEVSAAEYHGMAQSYQERDQLEEMQRDAHDKMVAAREAYEGYCTQCNKMTVNMIPIHEAGCPVENAFVRALKRCEDLEA